MSRALASMSRHQTSASRSLRCDQILAQLRVQRGAASLWPSPSSSAAAASRWVRTSADRSSSLARSWRGTSRRSESPRRSNRTPPSTAGPAGRRCSRRGRRCTDRPSRCRPLPRASRAPHHGATAAASRGTIRVHVAGRAPPSALGVRTFRDTPHTPDAGPSVGCAAARGPRARVVSARGARLESDRRHYTLPPRRARRRLFARRRRLLLDRCVGRHRRERRRHAGVHVARSEPRRARR